MNFGGPFYNLFGTSKPDIQDDGVFVTSWGSVNTINFTGTGVTASFSAGVLTVNVTGGGGGGGVSSVASADGSITVTNPTAAVDLAVVKAPILSTARTIGTLTGDATSTGSSFNGSANNTNVLTLATVNANVGSFGSATQVATFTVNGKGLITAASNVTITPAASSITGGAALTRTNDTNVTLTLGGTPSTALLAAASMTLGWTGTLAVSRGGSGVGTITGLIKGNGTSAFSAAVAGTDYMAANGSGLVEQIAFQDINTSISASTYTLLFYANYAFTINELKIISGAGTCTAAVQINGTNVTSISAVSVSTTVATGTASGANSVSVGQKVTLVITSPTSLDNLQATLKITRA